MSGAAAGRGIKQLYRLSTAMAEFTGKSEMTRSQATKKIWDYAKTNNLQHPQDGRIILPDEKLKNLFGVSDKIGGFTTLPGLISKHLHRM